MDSELPASGGVRAEAGWPLPRDALGGSLEAPSASSGLAHHKE